MTAGIDERLAHRLEAFNDIVIAFSLAEIAFNLKEPARSADIFRQPIHLFGFLVGFAFLAVIWWLLYKIFARYFIPDALGVVVNFILLAAVVLFAWAQQLFYQYGLDLTTTLLYGATGGVVYLLLGVLFFRGSRDGRLHLTDQERQWGLQRSVRTFIVGGALLLSLTLAAFGADRVIDSWLIIPIAIVLWRLASRIRKTAAGGEGG